MVEEIVFHLGDCKTGTTSIQAVLARGAWTLDGQAGRGIVYPAQVNHIPLASRFGCPLRSHLKPSGFPASERLSPEVMPALG